MTWLHPALLLGLGLVAAPVLLHLLMRQKPKKLVFPALRLIEQRRKQNQRRFRLRHLWLLLLRMAALAALVAAVARPTLPAANYGLNLRESLTLAGVIASGIAVYYGILSRWRRRERPKYDFHLQRAQLRGWTVAGTLAAAVLLIGWPYQRRVAAEITSPAPTGQFDLPVAAVFLFDTSLSMQYMQEGQTRLEAASQLATEHLRDFPTGSRVAICETSNDNPLIYQASISAAQARLDALSLSPVTLSINDRLRAAIALQADDREKTVAEMSSSAEARRKDRFIRRVYLFTDLATTNWRLGASKTLQQELERVPGLTLQLVDVGDLQPKNVAIRELKLSRQRVPVGGTLVVSAVVSSTGEGGDRKATLLLNSAQGQPIARDSQVNAVEMEGLRKFDFAMLTRLTGPVVHGEVRLESSDPLKFDDVRYFTANVGQPPKVLVVAPRPQTATELMAALDPFGGRGDELKFEPVQIEPLRLPATDLTDFDVVYLVNVAELAREVWTKLGTYVEQGGGLVVVLGSTEIDPVSYNRPEAQQFLPAELDVWKSEADFQFSLDQREHPLFWRFRQFEANGSFAAFENDVHVSRFWRLKSPYAAGASVLATYTDRDRSPSLIERPHGRGRTIMFSTAVNLPDDYRARWNNLTSPQISAWLWLGFVDQLTEYLARTTELQFNVLAGEPVALPVPPADANREYLLRRPEFAQIRKVVPGGQSQLVVDETRDIGHYDLAVVGQPASIAGFSVNVRPDESDLTRVTNEQLDELLGKDNYQIARTLAEIKSDVNVRDLGKEVFPLVLLLAILAFCGEHFVANWFYDVDGDASARSAPTALRPDSGPRTSPAAPAHAHP